MSHHVDRTYNALALQHVQRHGALPCAGEGVAQDMYVAAELIDAAAEAGNPDAQAEVGFRAALGLHPMSQTSFAFGEPDVPKCGPAPRTHAHGKAFFS